MAIDLNSVLLLFVLSLLPTFEGRYAVIVGIKLFDPYIAIFIASIANIVLSVVLANAMPLLDKVFYLFTQYRSQILKTIGELYFRYLNNVRRRAKPYIERYGVLGLIIFVAIPLPATGIWTGAIAAYILGFTKRNALISLIIGGMLSVAITSIATLLIP